MILDRRTGNGGEYWYYFCRARQDHGCDAPYVRVEDAEAAVVEHYATLRLEPELHKRMQSVLDGTLDDEERSARLMHAHLAETLRDLEVKEENLLDLVESGGTVAAKVRSRLAAIAEERERVQTELAKAGPGLEAGAALVQAALDLLQDPQSLYRDTTDVVRRQLNQVFFGKLYIDGDGVVDDELADSFDGVHYHRNVRKPTTAPRRSRAPKKMSGTPRDAAHRNSTGADLLDRIVCDDGSSKAAMVELMSNYLNPTLTTDRLRDLRRKAGRGRQAATTQKSVRRHSRLQETAIDDLTSEYLAGATMKSLAVRYGVHRSTVSHLLRRNGVEPRQQGITESQAKEAVRLYDEGWSVARLGDRYSVDGTTVWRSLRQYGVLMRAPWDR